MSHILVIYDDDGERSCFLEHPEDCPYDHDDSFVIGGKFYRCDVGEVWAGAGEDAVADIEELKPGRYPVKVVVEHTPSLPTNGGEEWDVWLEVAM